MPSLSRRSPAWSLALLAVLGASAWMAAPAPARQDDAEPKPETPPEAPAIYPRVSVATWYRVDPRWPQTPETFESGAVPGIAVGPDNLIYVAVRAQPPIRVFRPDGSFVRAFGSEHVDTAHHLKFDPEGYLWLADIGDHTLKRFSRDGELLEVLGTPGEQGKGSEHFNMPTDIVVTPAGDRFIADGYGNGRIVHLDANGEFVKAWGELGVARGQFSIPHAIALDSEGRLYVADRNNVRVQIFNQDGEWLDSWESVIVPWGFAPSKDDGLWICGSTPMPWRLTDVTLGCPPKDQVFMKFSPEGRLLQTWSVPKGEDGRERPGDCNLVHCIAEDADGNLYVGDIVGQN